MKKTSEAGTLFIRYKELIGKTPKRRSFFLINKLGGLNLIQESIIYYKKVDSFKNVKSLERAHKLVLSKNPGNIDKAYFIDYNNRLIQIKIESNLTRKSEDNFSTTKHKIII